MIFSDAELAIIALRGDVIRTLKEIHAYETAAALEAELRTLIAGYLA